MRKINFDITGVRFGRLLITCRHSKPGLRGGVVWKAKCDCGNTAFVRTGNVLSGATKSCGCFRRENTWKIHGESRNGKTTPEYRAYHNMTSRCTLKTNPAWERYGGRGITVCDRWLHSYKNFLEDMGRKPSQRHSMERKDNSKGYSPENCEWATLKQQANNKRNTLLIRYGRETKCFEDWCRHFGVNVGTAYFRLQRGVPFLAAMSKEKMKGGKGRTLSGAGDKRICDFRKLLKEQGLLVTS